MSVFHDEVEIEDFEYDEDTETYFFPCPCGDKFAITKVGGGPTIKGIRASLHLFDLFLLYLCFENLLLGLV